jgi:hypothetical protein
VLGFTVLFPKNFHHPDDSQVNALLALLVNRGVLSDAPYKETASVSNWYNGPQWDRLGIVSHSTRMVAIFQKQDPNEFDPDELDEPWEKAVAKSSLTITIFESGPPHLIDQTDPIWREMAEAIGDELAIEYYHV